MPAAFRSELEGDGYVRLKWDEQSEVALYGGAKGPVAFDNKCPHRGASIYQETVGSAPPRCRYHGRLADPRTLHSGQVRSVASWGSGGLVWVGPVNERLPQLPEDLVGQLDLIPPLRRHSVFEMVMDCHWTVAVENALDFEHVPHVHPTSLGKLGIKQLSLRAFDGGHTVEKFSIDPEVRRRIDKLGFPASPCGYMHMHIHPYTCISSTMGLSYSMQHYLPRDDGKTNFIHRLYEVAWPGQRPLPRAFYDSAAALNRQTFIEDALVCALVDHRAVQRLGPSDARIVNFREQCRRDLEG